MEDIKINTRVCDICSRLFDILWSLFGMKNYDTYTMYASNSTNIQRWEFRSYRTVLVSVKTLVPVHVCNNTGRVIYVCEKLGKYNRVVKRSSYIWKVKGFKNMMACFLGKKTPFECYVDDIVSKWSKQRIRVSEKDRRNAQSIPFKQVSKLCVEIYIEDQTIDEARLAGMFQTKKVSCE